MEGYGDRGANIVTNTKKKKIDSAGKCLKVLVCGDVVLFVVFFF